MKLDKKVKENAIIGHCFNTDEMTKYIGQECYFTDNMSVFGILSNSIKRVLVNVDNDREYPYETKSNDDDGSLYYSFCLPAEFVEEKTYRPFTDAKEFFIKTNFEVGDVIHIRSKPHNHEYHLLIIGWTDEGLMLGNFSEMTFDELLDKFELWDEEEGNFKPFGTEDTE